jgi:hypothetical protein
LSLIFSSVQLMKAYLSSTQCIMSDCIVVVVIT